MGNIPSFRQRYFGEPDGKTVEEHLTFIHNKINESRNRETFTIEHPAQYVTFNSITNNHAYGYELNFFRIKKESDPASKFTNELEIVPGETYQAYLYFHNNASRTLNSLKYDGFGVARDARMFIAMPAGAKEGQRTGITAYIGAKNATPPVVYCNCFVTTPKDVAFRHIPGSSKIFSKGAVNGKTLGSELFSEGAQLGFDDLDGNLPGCNEFSGYVTTKFRADFVDFDLRIESRAGTEGPWQSGNSVSVGDEIQLRFMYQNIGSVQQDNVVLKVLLPEGFEYVEGSTLLANSHHPSGIKDKDGITTHGVNIGSYAPRGNAAVRINVRVNSDVATHFDELGIARIRYTATTQNGNEQVVGCLYID